MKVQIKYVRGGRVKTVDDRFAKALVKAKMATYVEEEKQTYKTRDMKAETVKKKPGRPKKVKEEVVEDQEEDQTYQTKDLTAEE